VLECGLLVPSGARGRSVGVRCAVRDARGGLRAPRARPAVCLTEEMNGSAASRGALGAARWLEGTLCSRNWGDSVPLRLVCVGGLVLPAPPDLHNRLCTASPHGATRQT